MNQLLDCEHTRQYEWRHGLEHSNSNTYTYYVMRTSLCDYMCSFIEKLRQLEDLEMMNSVLENFSVLQVRVSWLHSSGGRDWIMERSV